MTMHFSTMVLLDNISLLQDKSPYFWEKLETSLFECLYHFGGSSVEHDCPKTEQNDWDEDCYHCSNCIWDWYGIGGRFSGVLTGYKPYKDPINHGLCVRCNGMGYIYQDSFLITPNSSEPTISKCSCLDIGVVPGITPKYYSRYKRYRGDVSTLNAWKSLPSDKKWCPHYIITEQQECFALDDLSFKDDFLATLDNISSDKLLLVVDIHN